MKHLYKVPVLAAGFYLMGKGVLAGLAGAGSIELALLVWCTGALCLMLIVHKQP